MWSHGFVDPSITVGEEGGRVGNVEEGEERSEEPNGCCPIAAMPSKKSHWLRYVRVPGPKQQIECVEMEAFCGSGFTAFALT